MNDVDQKAFEDWWNKQFKGVIGKIQEQANLRQGHYGWSVAAWQAALDYARGEMADKLGAAIQKAHGLTDYTECSGTPADCPENEGYGCCNRHKGTRHAE